MEVSDLIERAAESPSKIAGLSGVSRMTLKRLKDGSVTPNFNTLREIALALGLDVRIEIGPVSDGDAAVAARTLLDPEMDGVPVRESVREWVDRIGRHRFDDPRALVKYAGVMSSPMHRRGAQFFAPRPGIEGDRIPLVLVSAAGPDTYAISGGPAARVLTGVSHRAPALMWVHQRADISEIGRRIAETFAPAESFQPGGVLLAPTPEETFIDPFEEAGAVYTSPLQAVIDLYGLNAERAAEMISQDW